MPVSLIWKMGRQSPNFVKFSGFFLFFVCWHFELVIFGKYTIAFTQPRSKCQKSNKKLQKTKKPNFFAKKFALRLFPAEVRPVKVFQRGTFALSLTQPRPGQTGQANFELDHKTQFQALKNQIIWKSRFQTGCGNCFTSKETLCIIQAFILDKR